MDNVLKNKLQTQKMLIGIKSGLDTKKKGEKDSLKLADRFGSSSSLIKPSNSLSKMVKKQQKIKKLTKMMTLENLSSPTQV